MRDELRPVLKAAVITFFVVGLLMVFLHPPSLSGAPGLLVLIVGILAFVFLVAWGTVALSGNDSVSEPRPTTSCARPFETASSVEKSV